MRDTEASDVRTGAGLRSWRRGTPTCPRRSRPTASCDLSASPPHGKWSCRCAPVRSSRVRGRRSSHRTPGLGAAYTRRMGEVTVFEAVGGMPFFEALVDRFYEGVAADPDLLAVYPEPDDLSGARHRLTLFLAQYWGGPDTYGRERGHPRLRMRHAPFAVGPDARDRWLAHMREALDALDPPPELRGRFEEYFAFAAESMRNQD